MLPIDPRMTARRPDPAAEVARLEVERRLARGAAHAVNNALTAILGETSLLEDAHKHLPDVAEACDAIRNEVERCGRIWRSVLSPRPSANQGGDRVDLVRLVADVGLLLDRTLGRRVDLEARVPEDAPFGCVGADLVETLLFALVFHATDVHPNALRMRLEVTPREGRVVASLAVESADGGTDAAEAMLDPARAANDAMRTALETLPELVRRSGGSLASNAREGHVLVELELPAEG